MNAPLYEQVIRFFEEDGYKPERNDKDCVVTLKIQGSHSDYTVLVRTVEKSRVINFHTMLKEFAFGDHRQRVVEFVNRVNWGMLTGSFIFDIDEGGFMHRTTTILGDGELTRDIFQKAMDWNVQAMERYYKAYLTVASGKQTPAEAVAMAEGQ